MSIDAKSTIDSGCNESFDRIALPFSRYFWFFMLASIGAGADLFSKERVFAWRGLPGELPPWWIIEPYVGIETAVNHGALFGMGQGKGWLFSILAIGALLGIVIWMFRYRAASSLWLTVTMGLVMGGIVGNLYDRLGIPTLPNEYHGGVRDWILLTYGGYVWPNFNIADSLLVAGAIMLGVHSIFLQPSAAQKVSPS